MIEFGGGDEDDKPPGLPAWMATFADLMSLLMCFFVLLLAFSEMDVLKYKQVAGSMKEAFGVQNQVKAKDIPKGTSIIAQEFSPGRPAPTPMSVVNQFTVDTTKQTLDIRVDKPGINEQVGRGDGLDAPGESAKRLLVDKLKGLIDETAKDALKLSEKLYEEVEAGKIEIVASGRSITIRIREKWSFPSGSAVLNSGFIPVMAKLREVLKDIHGKIAVEGHTDNVPIANHQFRSNWELSSSRALTVTHELLRDGVIDDNRMVLIGYADTVPLEDNDSDENRGRNRRVEIVIRQGFDDETSAELNKLKQSEQDVLRSLKLEQHPNSLTLDAPSSVADGEEDKIRG